MNHLTEERGNKRVNTDEYSIYGDIDELEAPGKFIEFAS